jgi:hypothetical protein
MKGTPSQAVVDALDALTLRAEQAEAELAEARRERERWKRAAKGGRDGVVTYEYHLWMLKAVVAERRTAEQKATELAGEVGRLRRGLSEAFTPIGGVPIDLEGEWEYGDLERIVVAVAALAEGSRDG